MTHATLNIKTRFKMFYAGAWRPVTWMGDQRGERTYKPESAIRATLFMDDCWVPVAPAPGDIVTSDDEVRRRWVTIS